MTSKATRQADPDADPAIIGIYNSANAEFSISDCKFYVPVVTLSTKKENKLLEQLKTRFALTVGWNKYRCQISDQTVNNSLNYLIDPTFLKVHRLYILAFQNKEGRLSSSKYYTPTAPTVEINDYFNQSKTIF